MVDIVGVQLTPRGILYGDSSPVPVTHLGILDPAIGAKFHLQAAIGAAQKRKVLHAGSLEERNCRSISSISVRQAINLSVVAPALPEGDGERVVKCQGTGANGGNLVQLGGRPIAIGLPAASRTSGIGVFTRAKISGCGAVGNILILRPRNTSRRRAAGIA